MLSSAVQLTAKEGGYPMEVLFSYHKGGLLLLTLTYFLIMAGTVFGIIGVSWLTSTMGLSACASDFGEPHGLSTLGALTALPYAGAISAILLNIPGTPLTAAPC